jgi:hypothetical protein
VLFDITNLFLDDVLGGSLLPSTFPTYENLDDLSTNLPKDLVNQIGDILTQNVRLFSLPYNRFYNINRQYTC